MVSQSDITAWNEFVRAVDEKPPKWEIIEAVVRVFCDANIASPAEADGVHESDLTFPEGMTVAAKALVRRTLKTVEMSAQAERGKKDSPGDASSSTSGSSSLLPDPAVAGMLEVLGTEASAMAVAQAMAHGDRKVDVPRILEKIGCRDLHFALQPEVPVWQALQTESLAAAKAGRVAFAYVDLTAKQFMPLWMAPDATGGAAAMGDKAEWAIDPRAPSATLG